MFISLTLWGGGGSAAILCRVTHVPPHVKVDFSKRFRLPKNILFTQPDENKRVKSKNLFHLRTNICVPGPNKTSWIFSNEKCLRKFLKYTTLRNKCFELRTVVWIRECLFHSKNWAQRQYQKDAPNGWKKLRPTTLMSESPNFFYCWPSLREHFFDYHREGRVQTDWYIDRVPIFSYF